MNSRGLDRRAQLVSRDGFRHFNLGLAVAGFDLEELLHRAGQLVAARRLLYLSCKGCRDALRDLPRERLAGHFLVLTERTELLAQLVYFLPADDFQLLAHGG